jgi:hypothetical protein
MKQWIALAALGLGGCTLAPVIGDLPLEPSDRYHQCRRAADDYCKTLPGSTGSEFDRCLARATYECVAGAPSPIK